jgi:hypothetical protein
MQIEKLTVPLTHVRLGHSRIEVTQFQIHRGMSGPGKVKKRSKSVYLAFVLNSLDVHLQV